MTAAEPLNSDRHFAGYDLIGDVHGCADSLVKLLTLLGYSKQRGAYQFSNPSRPRQIIFMGDILDRGPKIREAMLIIREMVESGSAQIVMGNHEYNALGYTTLAPGNSNKTYLREHTESHTHSIQQTLDQYANHPGDWSDTLQWIYQWPLFLEFESFRVVHACWDQQLIDEFLLQRPDATIDHAFLLKSQDYKNFAGRFMSRTVRGVSLMLPDNLSMIGQDGYTRRAFRAKYWVKNPRTYGDVEFQPDALSSTVAKTLLSAAEIQQIPYYDKHQRPLFIGHYWQSGDPAPLTPNVACLDYSAVKNGRLVAYRMDGEQHLTANKFTWVHGNETLEL
ncbi:metallophosphoesterase [Oceanicoccus sp. KOV_DT_Chl]|uniref:metallophosphoesterase n=1 Tax=Oceanicoccus sp. KOV_DT_Chl TaxID=1904639 RepID=UPI000C7D826D|nr:metallophosphoesterase [Oceanicoccus sp. KOV_DT_Chl]